MGSMCIERGGQCERLRSSAGIIAHQVCCRGCSPPAAEAESLVGVCSFDWASASVAFPASGITEAGEAVEAASASFARRIRSVMTSKLGMFLYPLIFFSSRSTIGAGMPSGGVASASSVGGGIVGVDTRSGGAASAGSVGVIGRVFGGTTAVELCEDAVTLLEVAEFERSRFVGSLDPARGAVEGVAELTL
jgi:hypothetical protein